MNTNHHKYTNHLAREKSPYLLQHAHNPVDWHGWNEDTLRKAVSEDKPIILSIGYSSCHWCHVMEKESFENEEIGRYMSENFVCIKVDREERPDVDQIYMEAVQSMGIQGGWPLNVFLMPDQKPFYGGTYYPPAQWTKLLENVQISFEQQRDKLEESAEQFARHLSHSELQRYGIIEDDKQMEKQAYQEMLSNIYQKFATRFDQERGGMDKAPKFPMPSNWLFLLHYYYHTQDKQALNQLKLTLEQMAFGGIYDQIGGGFARYSVDERWFAPHFEKMLYDNGQLLSLYAEAFALTHKPLYKNVLEETVAFVKRELTSTEGGFYSALDADSEGEEGRFYVWKHAELQETLGDSTQIIADYYHVEEEGNWENGQNILYRNLAEDAFAKKYGLDRTELSELLEESKQKLLQKREERVRPGLDDKILTSWNGLMLKGLADTYATLQDVNILEAALRNAHFIVDKLMRKQVDKSSLYRSYKDGKAYLDAYLDDYAFVIDAFIALYQITFDEQWLRHAEQLTAYVVDHFYDPQEGFFHYTSEESQLIARKKELFDNVIPASNSAMAKNLYRLSLLLERKDYQEMSERMMNRILKILDSDPAYLTNWASLYMEMMQPSVEVVIIGEEYKAYSKAISAHYIPGKLISGTEKESTLPLLKDRNAIDGKTTVYVCFDKACKMPVHTIEAALEQLQDKKNFA
ncbi:thioredoxin domain-containing protein [Catalinimonas niigatensis]|uniref:thioredoxin domain-containing protein n=1 Tax=Catalinimonas niigatensis TaxID=1397264 RepID=UPI0026658CBE|nr:thioredoxin domain-containing protein [Catalinimonas niigatensis]WPP52074.1 thioredoxin domain-containing protein [Catalinimonas niigatensis]